MFPFPLAYVSQAIDWTYISYGLNYQLGAVLLAASPRWYLYQALDSNFCWMLPWAIVVTVLSFSSSLAWTYYAFIFGGALVFDLLDVGVTLLIWIHRLSRGKSMARAYIEYHSTRTDMRSRVGSRHQKYLRTDFFENGKQYDLSM